jgi:hypothetical protein
MHLYLYVFSRTCLFIAIVLICIRYKTVCCLKTGPRYITDSEGKKVGVLLPMKKYEKVMEGLENLYDRRLYDEAKKNDDGTRIGFSEYLKKRIAKHA